MIGKTRAIMSLQDGPEPMKKGHRASRGALRTGNPGWVHARLDISSSKGSIFSTTFALPST